MTRSPDDVVTEFCARWTTPDPDELAAYFTEDGVYHNMPMDPVVGRAAISAFITEFTSMVDGIDFRVHRQIATDSVVFNERTDVMRFKDGRELALPVAGVFEVHDGAIVAWRDYFDMATVTAAFG
ncbi:nuclear transport factor 2 family protein [Mycobacterium sp. Y57]|uniref:limonene-1,2-epoxide hydrolase family protein n=1 Tax=Mycolicibacterium xanthum TaxID=2796469 RepID=UPI001C856F19|nr:limonene-1,2-epoxide hydrolase family protein [Mycolicibacterium xanthum]MBX7433453.1 nuclear transport factor 2 family protein [Mycolicibacterium xanthum]